MAIVLNLQSHSVPLIEGGVLGPGEQRNTNTDNDYTESLIADHILVIIDADVPPPPDPEPLKDTIRKVFVSHAQPTFLPEGAIWQQLDDDGLHFQTWEMLGGTLRLREDSFASSVITDPDGSVIPGVGAPFVTSRLRQRDFVSIKDHSAGTPTGDADNTEAFGELFAEPGLSKINVPEHPTGYNYNVDGIVPLDRNGVLVQGAGRNSEIRQQLDGRMAFDVTGDDVEINDLTMGRASALSPRPSWAYSERDSVTNALYNQDSTSTRSAMLFVIGAQRFKSRGMRFQEVYCGMTLRPQNRFTTDPLEALWDVQIERPYFERFTFGINALGLTNPTLKGGHGRDTIVVDTVPPHLLYLAGVGTIPEDVVVPPKPVTGTAADDLFTTPTAHGYRNGSIVGFTVTSGGTGLPVEPTLLFVINEGRTTFTFKVSTTLNGSPVNFSSDMTGFVTTSPDLSQDGDSDYPPGVAYLPILGGEIAGWVDEGNLYSPSFKLRSCFRTNIHDMLSLASAEGFELSYLERCHLARLLAFDLQPYHAPLTDIVTDSPTLTGIQMNLCSWNEIEGFGIQSEHGEAHSGLTLRNGCVHNHFRGGHVDLKFPGTTTRAHLKLIDCSNNVFDGFSYAMKGPAGVQPTIPIKTWNAENNRINDPQAQVVDATYVQVADFDAFSHGNKMAVKRSALSMDVSPGTVAVDHAGDNTVTFPGEASSRVGQAGEYAPVVRPGLAPTVLTGQTIKASRYSPGYSYTATSLAFALTVLASADDPVVVGVFDETITLLGKSAITSGVLNGVANIGPSGTGLGAKALDLLTPVDFLEGQDYYIVALCTAASTTSQIEFATLLNTAAATMFGVAAGQIEFWHKTGQTALPAVGGQITGQVTQASGPFMAVRE